MARRAAAVLIAVSCVAASELRAQCADGSPPPCQVTRVAAREPTRAAPDPNRIAILPFRVTTTDTLLGEGFAELLATEFTGQGAPRAIDMATVLSAWRRAGGGLRTPLPRAKAMQLARDIGAGLVSEGSIVGLGRNITITATLFSAIDGTTRGTPARVTTNADSLESALRQAATSLLGAIGGEQRTTEARFTDSPDAMRSYLQGLSAWRRGRLQEATTSFDKAIAADSSFGQAMFRRYLTAVWAGGSGPLAPLAWERRERLAPQERIVLEGVLGAEYPKARTLDQRFADRARAANRLPDSPDAQYLMGDYWYHFAGPIDPVSQLTQARDYLMRAAALDSQATVLRHLLEVGVRLRDTALLRKVIPAYLDTEDYGKWAGGWIAAASVGDASLLSSLRRREVVTNDLRSFWPVGAAMMANISAAALDELFVRWSGSVPAALRDQFTAVQGDVLVSRGRPAAAERLWSTLIPATALEADRLRVHLALADGALGVDVASSTRRLAAAAAADTARVAGDACLSALWRAQRGDTTNFDIDRFTRPPAPTLCALAINLVRMRRDSSAETRAALVRADSVVRGLGDSPMRGSLVVLLAKAWEANGDTKRALSAIRYRLLGLGFGESPWTLPYEGRLAAIVGDTTGALRAYRYWLEINADAEAIFTPKRDSVRAEIARLTRRIVP